MTTGAFAEAIHNKMNPNLQQAADFKAACNMYERLMVEQLGAVVKQWEETFNQRMVDKTTGEVVRELVQHAYPAVDIEEVVDSCEHDAALHERLQEDAREDEAAEEGDSEEDESQGGEPLQRFDVRVLHLNQGQYTLMGEIIGPEEFMFAVLHGYAVFFRSLKTDEDTDKILRSSVEVKRGNSLTSDDVHVTFTISGDASAISRVLASRDRMNF